MFTLIVLTVAAAEAAVGLALIISIYRRRSTVVAEEIDLIEVVSSADALHSLGVLMSLTPEQLQLITWLIPVPPLLVVCADRAVHQSEQGRQPHGCHRLDGRCRG